MGILKRKCDSVNRKMKSLLSSRFRKRTNDSNDEQSNESISETFDESFQNVISDDFSDEMDNNVFSNDVSTISSDVIVNKTNQFEDLLENCNFSSLNIQQQQSIITMQNYIGLFLNQIRHNLSNKAVVDIAYMNNISNSYNESELFCKSYQTMCKRAMIFKPTKDRYFYCDCGLIGPIDKTKMACKVSCNSCLTEITPIAKINSDNSSGYFCYTKLRGYLEFLLPQIHKFLDFELSQTSDLTDITSGTEYRRLASKDTIVIYFGFDGVKYTDEKGGKSIWPLVMYICELPFDLRMKFAFPIAVHAGSDQPTCNMLQPFADELYNLMNEPVTFNIDTKNGPTEVNLFVKLLLGICDAPARAKVLNMLQHNGKHSCNICKILSVRDNDLGCMVYPLCTDFDLRTDAEWRDIATEAHQIKDNILGIKGIL